MRYVRFVLSELPLDTRKKAAMLVSDGLVRELKRDLTAGPVDQRMRALFLLEAALAMREALKPRDRTEWLVEVDVWLEEVGPLPERGALLLAA